MRFTRAHHPLLFGGSVAAVMALAACSDMPTSSPEQSAPVPDAPRPLLAASLVAHPGRTLAANCFQCHGTDGYAGELKIAGESASEIIGELDEMRAKNVRGNIMNVHAAAYTPQEIALIADYFAKQGG